MARASETKWGSIKHNVSKFAQSVPKCARTSVILARVMRISVAMLYVKHPKGLDLDLSIVGTALQSEPFGRDAHDASS